MRISDWSSDVCSSDLEGYLQRRDVRELMARVVRVEIDEADPQQTLFSPADRVEIELTGGEVISGPQIRFAPGHARNPAAPSKLQSKFEACTSTRLDEAGSHRPFSMLPAMPDQTRVTELYAV